MPFTEDWGDLGSPQVPRSYLHGPRGSWGSWDKRLKDRLPPKDTHAHEHTCSATLPCPHLQCAGREAWPITRLAKIQLTS